VGKSTFALINVQLLNLSANQPTHYKNRSVSNSPPLPCWAACWYTRITNLANMMYAPTVSQ
jgi:hypothetical protein